VTLVHGRDFCPMDWDQVRGEVEERLRKICVALPEVHEGPAWNGRSWLIRKNHFCQVFTIADGEAHKGVMIFRSESPELDALIHAGHPFFKPRWGTRAIGMVIDDSTDWDEVAELIIDSYCIQAPKKLAALVNRPTG
jgi:hypothetical protein